MRCLFSDPQDLRLKCPSPGGNDRRGVPASSRCRVPGLKLIRNRQFHQAAPPPMAAWRADNPADGSTTRCGVTPRVNSLRIGDFLMSILGSLPGFSHVRTAQTALAVALIVLGVSSCDPGDSRSVSGTSPAASRTAPQSPDANPIPEASRIPEKKPMRRQTQLGQSRGTVHKRIARRRRTRGTRR